MTSANEASSSPPKSKRQLRIATRARVLMRLETMTDFFKPILEVIVAKAQDEEAACAAATKLSTWLNALPGPDAGDRDEAEGTALEDDFNEAAYRTRAFASAGENQGALYRLADHTDEWFADDNTAFRTYYVCLAGGSVWPCATVIRSDVWQRLHPDMSTTKQRWYCTECHAKYKTSFGVLIEMVLRDMCLYALADFPPHHIEDAKRM